jgi:hypothetical protein
MRQHLAVATEQDSEGEILNHKPLSQIVAEHPFPDYAQWWQVGQTFLSFMSEAIVSEWHGLHGQNGNLARVEAYTSHYLHLVYDQEKRDSLVANFAGNRFTGPIQSGEFDALSYAFFRSAFESIEKHIAAYEHGVSRERRLFTKRVGSAFYAQLHDHLRLDLPASLDDEGAFTRLKAAIQQVGRFLQTEGYLRDLFDFTFTVDLQQNGKRIRQTEAQFLDDLKHHGLGYALYEMGYPVILPSAVYLYHTIGEAQHHSSRTIEELFALVGYEAQETDDFDPTGFPPDRVVELWEISKR